MNVLSQVNEILTNAVYKRPEKPYRNVYFIKVLNPGDRTNFFISFRWKSSKNEVFICTTDIDLNRTDKNVRVSISYLKVRERESTTFFSQRLAIPHRDIGDIAKNVVAPLIAEKLEKIESMYGTN